jgi:endo-1,3-1,4-beta-glycanase ExoK
MFATIALVAGPVIARAVDPQVSIGGVTDASTATATSWQLVQSEDFNGTAVDTSKWSIYGPWIPGNAGYGVRDGRALTVGNGLLTITARMINGTLVSGGISDRLNQAYGKFEFRVRTDADPSAATSGVILTWPQSQRWPIDGENDIYETLTDPDRDPVASFVHYGSTNQQYWFHHNVDGTAWHTFGMEWTPTAIKMLRDGAVVWTVSDTAAIPDVAHHLSIQLDAFKSSMSGTVRMQVDWVRIYKLASGSTADTTAPTTSMRVPALASGVSLNAGRPTLRLQWAAADAASGVHYVDVAQSTDGGAYVQIASKGPPWSLNRLVSPGHTYRYRVRAVDNAGNVGAWSYGPTSRISAVSQSSRSVHYAGTWSGSTSTMWWGGTARSSSRAGSSATYTFTGRSIAWVGLKAVNRGKARVYVNGVLKATVDLYSTTTLKQRIVWSINYATSASRTVRIAVLGTAGRPRVDIDGFIVGG